MAKYSENTARAITRVEGRNSAHSAHSAHTTPISHVRTVSAEVAQCQAQIDLASWYSSKLSNPSKNDLLMYPILADDYDDC